MGELFADMEKKDIQAERQNTAREKKRADEAEKSAAEALSRAATAEENEIKSIIEICQELGASKNSAVEKLMAKKNLSREASLEKTVVYWKS